MDTYIYIYMYRSVPKYIWMAANATTPCPAGMTLTNYYDYHCQLHLFPMLIATPLPTSRHLGTWIQWQLNQCDPTGAGHGKYGMSLNGSSLSYALREIQMKLPCDTGIIYDPSTPPCLSDDNNDDDIYIYIYSSGHIYMLVGQTAAGSFQQRQQGTDRALTGHNETTGREQNYGHCIIMDFSIGFTSISWQFCVVLGITWAYLCETLCHSYPGVWHPAAIPGSLELLLSIRCHHPPPTYHQSEPHRLDVWLNDEMSLTAGKAVVASLYCEDYYHAEPRTTRDERKNRQRHPSLIQEGLVHDSSYHLTTILYPQPRPADIVYNCTIIPLHGCCNLSDNMWRLRYQNIRSMTHTMQLVKGTHCLSLPGYSDYYNWGQCNGVRYGNGGYSLSLGYIIHYNLSGQVIAHNRCIHNYVYSCYIYDLGGVAAAIEGEKQVSSGVAPAKEGEGLVSSGVALAKEGERQVSSGVAPAHKGEGHVSNGVALAKEGEGQVPSGVGPAEEGGRQVLGGVAPAIEGERQVSNGAAPAKEGGKLDHAYRPLRFGYHDYLLQGTNMDLWHNMTSRYRVGWWTYATYGGTNKDSYGKLQSNVGAYHWAMRMNQLNWIWQQRIWLLSIWIGQLHIRTAQHIYYHHIMRHTGVRWATTHQGALQLGKHPIMLLYGMNYLVNYDLRFLISGLHPHPGPITDITLQVQSVTSLTSGLQRLSGSIGYMFVQETSIPPWNFAETRQKLKELNLKGILTAADSELITACDWRCGTFVLQRQ